ncbi:MAG: pyrroline-5-carboxylate reductase [Cellulosilyticaceae bacterium]
MKTIGFIGIGNMGGAMLKRMAENKETRLEVYDVNQSLYGAYQSENVICETHIEDVVKKSRYLILTVKPQYYEQVCEQIKLYLNAEHIIVTVAPGVSIETMKERLGETTKIVRTMPNTPAMVGCGVTAYCYHKEEIDEETIAYLQSCFESFGKAYCVEEKQMDAVVPTTGSSPAYGYMFIEAMGDAAVRFGLPRQMAYEMAALALKGACEMVLQTKEHPGALKDAVTSPAGTTIEAVAKLEETGFRNSVIASMTACFEKTQSMKG